MNAEDWTEALQFDRAHIWHPYASMTDPPPVLPVVSAQGVRLRLADGRELIDGMASWWCAIHGYGHPALHRAFTAQLGRMAHVMFGGLTHEPGIRLARRLGEIAPEGLDRVFFSDSGSVSVEVAMKMAVQYWNARGRKKTRFIALRNAYHGDTLGAMSVCDPVTGMHRLFADAVPTQLFAPAPRCRFDDDWDPADADALEKLITNHREETAALIIEPVVQGAGGMRFYHPAYLERARELCDAFDVLLIADEIATGFGRSGRLFACEYAGVRPDILCVGKALTGGSLTLAATLTTPDVAETISSGGAGCFMHGPTFMANPLACAVATASIDLLLASDWRRGVDGIAAGLREGLGPCAELPSVAEVRVLGAIGVVEMKDPVDLRRLTPAFVKEGIWLRPFGRLVYTMPPYVINAEDLRRLTAGIRRVLEKAGDG